MFTDYCSMTEIRKLTNHPPKGHGAICCLRVIFLHSGKLPPSFCLGHYWFTALFFTLLYTLFIRKKVFTLSREYFFLLIFRSFKCEGFEFQMFTLQVLMLLSHRFSVLFSVNACTFNRSQQTGNYCRINGNKKISLKNKSLSDIFLMYRY